MRLLGLSPGAPVFLRKLQSCRSFKTDLFIHVIIKENTAALTALISDL